MLRSLKKIISLLLIIGLNWSAISAIGWTQAYFNDTEMSEGNAMAAGILDFALTSPGDFSPVALNRGESATRTIDIINYGNAHKYTITAVNFVGALCGYLDLKANLDGDSVEYSGVLTGFTFGPIAFEEPENWVYTLTLPTDAPESAEGATCQFDFVVFGSQTRNDLPFGQGFSDTEDISNSIAASPPNECRLRLTKTTESDNVNPDDTIIYHLTFDNVGQKVCTGGGVKLKDTFGDHLQYLGYASSRVPRSFSNFCTYLEWNFGSIYPNDPMIEIDLTMKVKSSAKCDSTITNSANYWSDQTKWGKEAVTADTHVVCGLLPGIVINEFLPNPKGDDWQNGLQGEWVELYNLNDAAIDVADWQIKDAGPNHTITISNLNTNSGFTIIGPKGSGNEWLVVYMNHSVLNNNGDTVSLYNSVGNLMDSHSYDTSNYCALTPTPDTTNNGGIPSGSCSTVPENKSYARIPDGTGSWVDPIPTPGKTNVTPENLELAGLDIDYFIGEEIHTPIPSQEGNTTDSNLSQEGNDTGVDDIDNGKSADNSGSSDSDDNSDYINTDDTSINSIDNENGNNTDDTDTDNDDSDIFQTASLKDEDSGGLDGDSENGDGNDDGGSPDNDLGNLTNSNDSDSGEQDNTADNSGGTSANDDMPIKSDADSTEIIFSV